MMEQMKMQDGLARATEVIGDTLAENERLQAEVDDLNEQLEQRDQEIEDLHRQHQQEIEDLQRQLLEARNQHMEATAGGEEPAYGDGATDGGQDERTGIEVLHQTGRAAQISKAQEGIFC